MSFLTVGALIGTVVSLLVYLLVARTDLQKTRFLKDFFFFDWSLHTRQVAATIFASGMSLATVIFSLLQLGVIFGVGLSWATITYCLGWIVLAIVSPRIRKLAQKTDTLHSFLGQSYSSRHVAVAAAVTTLIGFVGTFATELFAASLLAESLGFSSIVGTVTICVFAAVTILYSSMGGFRSVIRSDRIQSALLIPAVVGVAALGIYYWMVNGKPPLLDNPLATKFTLPLSVVVSLALINMLFPIVDMSAWQRILAARSDRVFKRGSVLVI